MLRYDDQHVLCAAGDTGVTLIERVGGGPATSLIRPAQIGRDSDMDIAPAGDEAAEKRRPDMRCHRLLLQLASTTSAATDPAEIGRIAVDTLVSFLEADRGFLLTMSEEGRMRVLVGRDDHGSDLPDPHSYNHTVVERVSAQRQAVITAYDADDALLEPASAASHGVRSIIATPLLVDDRLIGVLCLDSRVGKCIFSAEDCEILVAASSYVGFVLETKRTAALEAQAEFEKEKHDLADIFRASTASLSHPFEPDQVLSQTLIAVTGAAHADFGCVLAENPSGGETVLTVHPAHLAQCLPTNPSWTAIEPAFGHPDGALLTGSQVPSWARGIRGAGSSWLLVDLALDDGKPRALLLHLTRSTGLCEPRMTIVKSLLAQAAVSYRNAELFQRVQRMATTDDLTGLLNRRQFLRQAIDRLAAPDGADTLAGFMIDIDYFKRVNDTHGHPVGDEVIRAVAQRIAAAVRPDAIVGRFGGEEIAILATVDGQPGVAADRIRQAVANGDIATSAGPVRVTVSIGVATADVGRASMDTTLRRADIALYRAKSEGRNRAVHV